MVKKTKKKYNSLFNRLFGNSIKSNVLKRAVKTDALQAQGLNSKDRRKVVVYMASVEKDEFLKNKKKKIPVLVQWQTNDGNYKTVRMDVILNKEKLKLSVGKDEVVANKKQPLTVDSRILFVQDADGKRTFLEEIYKLTGLGVNINGKWGISLSTDLIIVDPTGRTPVEKLVGGNYDETCKGNIVEQHVICEVLDFISNLFLNAGNQDPFKHFKLRHKKNLYQIFSESCTSQAPQRGKASPSMSHENIKTTLKNLAKEPDSPFNLLLEPSKSQTHEAAHYITKRLFFSFDLFGFDYKRAFTIYLRRMFNGSTSYDNIEANRFILGEEATLPHMLTDNLDVGHFYAWQHFFDKLEGSAEFNDANLVGLTLIHEATLACYKRGREQAGLLIESLSVDIYKQHGVNHVIIDCIASKTGLFDGLLALLNYNLSIFKDVCRDCQKELEAICHDGSFNLEINCALDDDRLVGRYLKNQGKNVRCLKRNYLYGAKSIESIFLITFLKIFCHALITGKTFDELSKFIQISLAIMFENNAIPKNKNELDIAFLTSLQQKGLGLIHEVNHIIKILNTINESLEKKLDALNSYKQTIATNNNNMEPKARENILKNIDEMLSTIKKNKNKIHLYKTKFQKLSFFNKKTSTSIQINPITDKLFLVFNEFLDKDSYNSLLQEFGKSPSTGRDLKKVIKTLKKDSTPLKKALCSIFEKNPSFENRMQYVLGQLRDVVSLSTISRDPLQELMDKNQVADE